MARLRAPPRPAKLSRPSAAGLIRRDRLFRSLDEASRARVVWVSAPAGAGKTSLVTTWIETRNLIASWYRFDGADADPATLFQALRQAVAERQGAEPLPAFAPVHGLPLEVFARQFFAAWCTRFDEAATLVFDNYEQVDPHSRVDAVLAALLDELPSHLRVIVMSRGAPPAALARWAASPDLNVVPWDELRFSDSEATALAASWGVGDEERAVPIIRTARGWAAGIVLMLRAARAGITLGSEGSDVLHGLFDYFATEICARLPLETQQFLLRTAFLPDVTVALAQVLTGEPRARRILTELHADNFFIERKQSSGGNVPAASISYEYHPLFRDFLRQRAREQLDRGALNDLLRRTASVLEAAGEVESSVQLLSEAGDDDRLVALIVQQAPSLSRSARFATLRQWIERVPAERVGRTPRLLMWLGVCKLANRESDAERAMAIAREACDAARDTVGSFGVRCWLLLTTQAVNDLQQHVAELRSLVDTQWDGLTPAQQLEALAHFRVDLRAASMLPLMRSLRERIDPLFARSTDMEAKLHFGAFLCMCTSVTGELDRLRELELELRTALDTGHGSTLVRAAILVSVSYGWAFCRTAADNRRLLQELNALTDVGGVFLDQVGVWLAAFRAAIAGRDRTAAEALERRLRPIVRLVPFRRIYFLIGEVRLHLEAGRHVEALRDARELNTISADGASMRGPALAILAEVALSTGDTETAHAHAVSALGKAREWGHGALIFTTLLLLAIAQRRRGELAAARASLAEALSLTRQQGVVRNMLTDALMTEAMATALREDIERETALHVIEANELPPPAPDDVEGWPRPIRLRVLGAVALERSAVLASERESTTPHATKRPMELLLFLVAQSGGPVAISSAMDALWPNAEGDAAKKSLEITLHRLRRLLGAAESVRQEGGRLSLDTRHCWVDSIVFVRLAERAEQSAPSDDELLHMLVMYRGHFMGDECEAPWALVHRERVRRHYLRLVEAAVRRFVDNGRPEMVELCHRRALELDPAAEVQYRRLMQSLAAGGDAVISPAAERSHQRSVAMRNDALSGEPQRPQSPSSFPANHRKRWPG